MTLEEKNDFKRAYNNLFSRNKRSIVCRFSLVKVHFVESASAFINSAATFRFFLLKLQSVYQIVSVHLHTQSFFAPTSH